MLVRSVLFADAEFVLGEKGVNFGTTVSRIEDATQSITPHALFQMPLAFGTGPTIFEFTATPNTYHDECGACEFTNIANGFQNRPLGVNGAGGIARAKRP